MDNALDFIGYLKNYCKKNNIFFIAGPQDYQNAVIDKNIYAPYDLILIADLTFTPNFSDELGTVVYDGTIGLGRKKEDFTTSSLDETFQQKYDRRLLSLSEAIVNMFNEMQCTDDIEVLSWTGSYALNRYDLNADFVVANISIKVRD